jgi:HKD family nuclease
MKSLIHHPAGDIRLGTLLLENLRQARWDTFKAAVGFAKRSGTKHVAPAIRTFAGRGGVQLSIGIDQGGTSAEALQDLLDAVGEKGRVFIFHNLAHSSFHPKMYLFRNDSLAECFIGSGNLTEGGLFTNYEAFVQMKLEIANVRDAEFLENMDRLLDDWADPAQKTVQHLTQALISQLQTAGLLLTEAQIRERNETTKPKERSGTEPTHNLFAAVAVNPAPPVAVAPPAKPTDASGTPSSGAAAAIVTASIRRPAFLMTLQNTDVGIGQTTAGTSKRSPEIFIPIGAVRENPDFWGWPGLFEPDLSWTKKRDSEGRGKMDRKSVRMSLRSRTLSVNWWYNPDKIDIRMRNSDLRDAGNVGDIMRIEKTDTAIGYDYLVKIIKPFDAEFEATLAACSTKVRAPSKKRYGYL